MKNKPKICPKCNGNKFLRITAYTLRGRPKTKTNVSKVWRCQTPGCKYKCPAT